MKQADSQKAFRVTVQLIDNIPKIPELFDIVMSSYDMRISMQLPKKVLVIEKNKEYLIYLDNKPIPDENRFDLYMQGKVLSIYKNDKFKLNISIGGLIASIEAAKYSCDFKIGDNVYFAITKVV